MSTSLKVVVILTHVSFRNVGGTNHGTQDRLHQGVAELEPETQCSYTYLAKELNTKQEVKQLSGSSLPYMEVKSHSPLTKDVVKLRCAVFIDD
jgi:hypothetical protein